MPSPSTDLRVRLQLRSLCSPYRAAMPTTIRAYRNSLRLSGWFEIRMRQGELLIWLGLQSNSLFTSLVGTHARMQSELVAINVSEINGAEQRKNNTFNGQF